MAITEFILFVLTATLGGMFLCGANDLITIFVAPECFSLCSYLLSGYTKKDVRSNEATMKYLLMGGASSSILESGPCLSPSVADHPLGPATDHRLDAMSTIPGFNQIQFEGFCRFIDQGLTEELSKFPKIEDSNMEKTKLFQAPTEPEAPLLSKRGGWVIHISFDIK
ncbi:hypothetical protein CASFOL_007793 [Castilleja foliolosa]|uniref:NADH:quinone oxidoreductase/Mrp antiporter transmembrane domain-containing protein n=1 Tax=Castilleja foliolosa TaxID=1961234 RepID=A0ABD3E5M5_9LAMI